MMSSILTVNNILNNNLKNDPWMINIDAEYHEEKEDQIKVFKKFKTIPGKLIKIQIVYDLCFQKLYYRNYFLTIKYLKLNHYKYLYFF